MEVSSRRNTDVVAGEAASICSAQTGGVCGKLLMENWAARMALRGRPLVWGNWERLAGSLALVWIQVCFFFFFKILFIYS